MRNASSALPLDGFMATAHALADTSRAMLREATQHRQDIDVKPDRTFVTSMDRAIEERLRAMIAERFPAHGIWGEEFGRDNPDAEFQWILDPIDGTAQFIAGIPVHATLIALALGDRPILGLMDFPATAERWTGCDGRPTLRNGTPCRTQACDGLAQAMMSTSSPDFYANVERPVLDALRAATRWRIYGGAAMSYARLATGRTQLACDTGFQVYDFAGFAPIIAGAGGVVSDWRGQPLTLRSGHQVLAAASPALHAEALVIIDNCIS